VLQVEGLLHKSGLIDWIHPPLCNATHRPRAWRLDTPLAQLYEIPSLLSPEDCRALMAAIDQGLVPSTVTRGPEDLLTNQRLSLNSN
jgi:prolyl 4-hydroxylase